MSSNDDFEEHDHNDVYVGLREQALRNVPFEFKHLRLQDEQKKELAELQKQQAEDFMY